MIQTNADRNEAIVLTTLWRIALWLRGLNQTAMLQKVSDSVNEEMIDVKIKMNRPAEVLQ